MSPPASPSGPWPAPLQERVLLAAFAPDNEARSAWDSLGALELRADRLACGFLPLACRRWSASESPVRELGRRIQLTAWSRNQERMLGLAAVLEAFERRGVESMLLKGAALLLGYYGDFGLRAMGDFDLMIREADLEPAAGALQQAGWVAEGGMAPAEVARRVRVRHACHFHTPGGAECDLHWRPVHRCHAPGITRMFWEAAETAAVHGHAVKIPCAADLFFHACVHGAQWDWTPQVRWVADALTVYHGAAALDPERLGRLGALSELRVALLETLAYLEERFRVDVGAVPAGEPAAWERREHILRMKPCPLSAWDSTLWHWYNFKRIRRVDPQWRARALPQAWAAYLKEFSGAANWREFAEMLRRRA
jgi:hypothetical protein